MEPSKFQEKIKKASRLLKPLANEHRFMILCLLLDGEKSVKELRHHTGLRHSTLSQHLARLRMEKLVQPRREAQRMFYSLLQPHELFGILRSLRGQLCETSEKTSN